MNANPVSDILARLDQALGGAAHPVALHEPRFCGRELEYVKECLDTTMVSSVGPFVDRFERDLAAITGCKHAVAVVNGTSALHVCLLLAGVRPGDEVLVPSLTFVATANAVSFCGAIPHFVDIDPATLGVDPAKLSSHLEDLLIKDNSGASVNRLTGRPVRALMPVHVFGHPADLDPLAEIAARFNLVLLEDAAEALGSFYKGRHAGNHGLVSALSFNGNKIITTGGGGAILTNNAELGQLAKHLTTTAKTPHPYRFFHDDAGFNYRLPNLNAALGCGQLERLDAMLAAKRRLASRYAEAFAGCENGRIFTEPAYAKSNCWLNAFVLAPDQAPLRDRIIEAAHKAKIFLRPAWEPLHTLPMYRDCPRMELSATLDMVSRLINLPSSAFLGETDG